MSYSERRAADRTTMANALETMAVELGATVERSEHEREISLRISAPGGLCVSVDLDGASCQPDVHVIPWHMGLDSDKRLARSFGDVNPYHFRKATHVARGWVALKEEIERGLRAAVDGSAYQD
jgi:hypothetical protein